MQKEIKSVDIRIGKEISELKKVNRTTTTLKVLAYGVTASLIVKVIEIASTTFDNLVINNFNNLKSILLNGTTLLGVFIPNWFTVILFMGIVLSIIQKGDKR